MLGREEICLTFKEFPVILTFENPSRYIRGTVLWFVSVDFREELTILKVAFRFYVCFELIK
jgi:hypothetical protein